MKKNPKYSFIIATYNRVDELKELFASLKNLENVVGYFEVIIVDDGSTDSTQETVNAFKNNFDISYHYQKNKGPGAARNTGMATAKGDYFIFLDSDCTVPADYLYSVDSALLQHGFEAFGGPDTYRDDFPPLLKAINYSMTSFIGTGGTRGNKTSVTKFYPRSFNMGIHRKVYEKIGGMGELRHGQDMDYSARIYKAGFKVGLIQDAFVYHKRRTSLWKFFKQIFNWGVARINLARIHPELLKPIHLAPSIILTVVAIGLGVSAALNIFSEYLLVMTVLYLLFAFTVLIQSYLWYKSLQVALLSIVTTTVQIVSYGLGVLYGLTQILFGKKEAKAFVKNYYQ